MFSTWFASKPVILFLAILGAAYLYGNFIKELVKKLFAGILNHRFREIHGEVQQRSHTSTAELQRPVTTRPASGQSFDSPFTFDSNFFMNEVDFYHS